MALKTDNLSLFGLIAALFAGPICSVVTCIGCTLVSIARIPQAIYQSYKTLILTQKLGPVLKFFLALLVVPMAVLLIPLVLIVTLIWGFGKGMAYSVEKGFTEAIGDSVRDIGRFNKDYAGQLIQEMVKWQVGDVPKNERYEIRILTGIKGLIGGSINAVALCVCVGVLSTVYVIPIFLKILGEIVSKGSANFFMRLLSFIMLVALTPLVYVASWIAGLFFGLGHGAYLCYTKGFRASLRDIAEATEDYKKFLQQILH